MYDLRIYKFHDYYISYYYYLVLQISKDYSLVMIKDKTRVEGLGKKRRSPKISPYRIFISSVVRRLIPCPSGRDDCEELVYECSISEKTIRRWIRRQKTVVGGRIGGLLRNISEVSELKIEE